MLSKSENLSSSLNGATNMKNKIIKDTLIKLLSNGHFSNNKNRVWTMCQVALKLCLQCVDEAEKEGFTNDSFYLAFEDCLNKISIKDHNKQDTSIVEDFKKFNADSGVE